MYEALAYFPLMTGLLQSTCGEANVCLQLPEQCIWELEMKEYSGGSWHIIHPMHGSLTVVADCLTPGTKYAFRARAGELSLCCSQQSCLSWHRLAMLVMRSLSQTLSWSMAQQKSQVCQGGSL